MVYCISDIHGDYDGYRELLERVHFSDADTLYVLCDVLYILYKKIEGC